MSDTVSATHGLILALTTAITSHGLYPRGHQQCSTAIERLDEAVQDLLVTKKADRVTFLVIDGELAVDGEPWRRAALYRLALVRALDRTQVERLTLAAGVSREELSVLCAGLSLRGPLDGSEHVVLGRVTLGDGSGGEEGRDDGAGSGSIEGVIDRLGDSMDQLVQTGAEGFVRLERAIWELMEETASGSRNLALLARLRTADDRLYRHSVNVCLHVINHARFLGLEGSVVHDLGVAAMLHDIGLVDLPPALREGRGAIDAEQQAMLRSHPDLGATRLAGIADVPPLPLLVAYEHHLHWDGRGGYPQANRRPGFAAQLTAVSDTWDSLRNLAEALLPADRDHYAAAGLRRRAGNRLDAFLVGTFLALVET